MVHRDRSAPSMGIPDASVRHLAARFDPAPDQVAHARDTVVTALDAWGFRPDLYVALAVSELVTNAIVHGAGPVEVTVGADGDLVRNEVADEGGGRPAIRTGASDADAPGGWGLQLVDQVADDWGTRHEDGRTVVWITRRCERKADDSV